MDRSMPIIRYKAPKKPKATSRLKAWKLKEPFRFFDLPVELRLRIYEFALIKDDRKAVDLDAMNPRKVAPRLRLLLTCRQIYNEAYPVFYGRQAIRIFPSSMQYFSPSKGVLLSRLPAHYRQVMSCLELWVGPGWASPPTSWVVNRKLGLSDCQAVHTLKIMIEFDPSDETFRAWRISKDYYTDFCGNLFDEILERTPSIQRIEFEAFSSVPADSPLLLKLFHSARDSGKQILWGREINRPKEA